jgi:hypothetical protein
MGIPLDFSDMYLKEYIRHSRCPILKIGGRNPLSILLYKSIANIDPMEVSRYGRFMWDIEPSLQILVMILLHVYTTGCPKVTPRTLRWKITQRIRDCSFS